MTRQTKIFWTMALVLSCCFPALAGDKKDKAKPSSQTVDSGSFGVFMKGQRVVTETFTIEQQNDISSIRHNSRKREAALQYKSRNCESLRPGN